MINSAKGIMVGTNMKLKLGFPTALEQKVLNFNIKKDTIMHTNNYTYTVKKIKKKFRLRTKNNF